MLDIKNKISGIFDKNKKNKEKSEELELPLNLKVGSILTLDQTIFTLCEGESYVEYPGKDLIVSHITKTTVASFHTYKFYIQSSTENEYYLEISTQTNDIKVQSIGLYQVLEQIFPETESEWNEWLGENGHIGQYEFESPGEITYYRVIGTSESRIEPIEAVESVILPKEDLEVSHLYMSYHRSLLDDASLKQKELLFVTAKEENSDSACIEISAGLELNLSDIEVF